MEDCIFCKIVNKDIPSEIIHETDHFLAFLNINPNNYGHTLIIPKKHADNIYELDEKSSSTLGYEISFISKIIKSAMNADGINVIMNNDKAAGQAVFHQHTHIIPRYLNDGFEHWEPKKYEYEGQIKEIAEKIRTSMLS
jgi:histidine triad (HIT) family protein